MRLYKSRKLLCTSMVGNGINPARQHCYEDSAPQFETGDVSELQAVTCGAHKSARETAASSSMQTSTQSKHNLHLIQTLQQQAWHQSAFPSQGLWIYCESYTLAVLQQSVFGCKGRAGVTRGSRYSQALRAAKTS